MTFRAFTIVLFLAGLFFQAFGQSEVGEVKKSFEEAVQQMILIKNQDDLIPLRRLDTLSIALAGVGLTPGCDLQRDLERYTNVKAQMAPRPNDIVSADEWIHNMSKEFDLVILGISDYESDKAQYLEHGYFIETLSRKMPTILGVFGGQTFSKNLPAAIKNAKAFLQTTHNDYAHSIMAQVIMGGIGTNGKLEETIEIDGADLGRGINTQPIERLRFSPPELVDMDRQILEDSIAAIVKEGIAKQAFPGAQVLVAKDGHVIYYEAFGHHTYDTLQKVTTKDLYDYASLTKITGALPALMQLHGSGKFDLDKTLGDYLPDFKNSNKGDLTFRSMLAHNAQLRPWVPYWQGAIKGNAKYPWKKSWNSGTTNNGKFRRKTMQTDSSSQFPIELTNKLWLHKDFKTKKIYQAIKKSPLNEKPGYVYSGLLFYLLPEMVEKLTNQDFSTYIQKNIYQRIGAYTIGFNPLNRFPKSRIVPTERDTFFRMIQIHGVVHDEGAAMMNGVSFKRWIIFYRNRPGQVDANLYEQWKLWRRTNICGQFCRRVYALSILPRK